MRTPPTIEWRPNKRRAVKEMAVLAKSSTCESEIFAVAVLQEHSAVHDAHHMSKPGGDQV